MVLQVRNSDAAWLAGSFAPRDIHWVTRWYLGGGWAGLVSKMVSLSRLALHVVSGPPHVVSPTRWLPFQHGRSGLQQQEEALSLKAWARKSPSVTSAIFYWSSNHRACDRRSDREFGVIFNLPKVEIKILTPRAVRIKRDNTCRGSFTVKLMKRQPWGSLIAWFLPRPST